MVIARKCSAVRQRGPGFDISVAISVEIASRSSSGNSMTHIVFPNPALEEGRLSATSAGMTLPGRSALLHEDGNSDQSGNRIEPWDMKSCIDSEASQRDERKIRASS